MAGTTEVRRTDRILEALAWIIPMLWAMPWALFRGAFAHGGFVWWERMHIGGLILLVLAALTVRTNLWRRRHARPPRSVGAHVLDQSVLVLLVVLANWLSFQAGIALHHPPESLSEFLWSAP